MSVEGSPALFFERLAAHAGTPPLDDEEAALVLRITKVVADWSERRFAPLTAYAAGLMIGAGATDRADRLRVLLRSVEALAAEDARG